MTADATKILGQHVVGLSPLLIKPPYKGKQNVAEAEPQTHFRKPDRAVQRVVGFVCRRRHVQTMACSDNSGWHARSAKRYQQCRSTTPDVQQAPRC
eukprot:357050-Chlamydomonas_euryale.AAC.2